ncbi:MAG: acyl-homoserine-lactone synthase [Burkholderiaceae bacterium]|jgi:N-acyl-L-homoserine lactone synthetase
MTFTPLNFTENRFTVRTLVSETDKLAAYQLRHKIYCEKLRWVPALTDGLEIDAYDRKGILLGAFWETGVLSSTLRFLKGNQDYMLEKEFKPLLPPGFILYKSRETAEVTRLATLVPLMKTHESRKLALDMIFKGMYFWSIANGIRFLYFVVERAFLRLMTMRGFPCKALAPALLFGKGNSECVAVLLDWQEIKTDQLNKSKVRYINWLREDSNASNIGAGSVFHFPL